MFILKIYGVMNEAYDIGLCWLQVYPFCSCHKIAPFKYNIDVLLYEEYFYCGYPHLGCY